MSRCIPRRWTLGGGAVDKTRARVYRFYDARDRVWRAQLGGLETSRGKEARTGRKEEGGDGETACGISAEVKCLL